MSQDSDTEHPLHPHHDEPPSRDWFLTNVIRLARATTPGCAECGPDRSGCNHGCPDCSQPVEEGASRCLWCWSDLLAAGTFPCPDCQRAIPIDDSHCGSCDATLGHFDTGDNVCGGEGFTWQGERHGLWQIDGYGMYGGTRCTYREGVLHGTRLLTSKPHLFIDRNHFGIVHGMSCGLVHPVYQHPIYQPPIAWDTRLPFLFFKWFHHGRLVWSIEQPELEDALRGAEGGMHLAPPEPGRDAD